MPVGVLIAPDRNSPNVIDDAVEKARGAYDAGVRQRWFGQQFDYDAIALAGLIGSAVPGVAVGTSVVPINPRHPLIVAAAAQTAQAASHGNFSLGLGLGVPFVEQLVFGISASHTVQRLSDYLTVLRAINEERTVDFHGSQITAVDPSVMPVALAGSTPFPIYVAAMGPRALEVTGELADGTLPANAGPRTSKGSSRRPSQRRQRMPAGHAHASSRWSTWGSQTTSTPPGPPPKAWRFDAGATDLVLLPLQTGDDDLRRVWEVAAAF
jgi:alkanesulfonate monooxygenase SsuD/methylene tetrahydromethanopterin reductase-like flavin-dependent oxidoreductase (luciferase family)